MKLLVTGVTRTGNLGGAAMLCAVEDVVADHVYDFALASILPRQDRNRPGPDHARIVAADYRYLLLVVAPLCLFLWPVRRLRFVRSMLARMPLLKDVNNCDAVADLSGVAFVDGRGVALLYYNVSVALPALFFGKPVHKLSQATGPFAQSINAFAARFIFSRCASVAARGAISLQHLRKLGIPFAAKRADVSFALNIPEKVHQLAKSEIAKCYRGKEGWPLLICSPSAVVRAHCKSVGVDMIGTLAEVLMEFSKSGVRVALLPHSTDTGIRKNDDMNVIFEVQQAARGKGVEIPIIDPHGDPRFARALIGQSTVFLASRFHSMIAALSQAVPVVTVGWSHKYAEAAEPFGMEKLTLDYADLTLANLREKIKSALAGQEQLRAAMRAAALESRVSATDGIMVILQRGQSR
jgi:polysaccharide pyruvyl transferase WcaK-like protein